MKKLALFFAAILFAGSISALSVTRSREEARFLTDKMAYELGLTPEQMYDVYEINYDYFRSLDDIYRNYSYEAELRERELRYILSAAQWRRYVGISYFFRPVSVIDGAWHFIVRRHYDHTRFYYAEPRGYHSYKGGRHYNYRPARREPVNVRPGHAGTPHRPNVGNGHPDSNHRDFNRDNHDRRNDRNVNRNDNRRDGNGVRAGHGRR